MSTTPARQPAYVATPDAPALVDEASWAHVRQRAREQWAMAHVQDRFPVDTLYVVSSCRKCRSNGLDAYGFPGDLVLADDGKTQTLGEVLAALAPRLETPPPNAPPLDPCRCGAPGSERRPAGLCFVHAMPGTGADLVLEARRTTSGVEWRGWRHPIEGEDVAIEPLEDASLVRVFRRPLSIVPGWKALFDRPAGGLVEVAEGQWVFAAPIEGAGLSAALDACVAGGWRRVFGVSPSALVQPPWAWLRELLLDAGRSAWTAGSLVDFGVLERHLRTQCARAGFAIESEGSRDRLIGKQGAWSWPFELETIAREAVDQLISLAHASALAVAVASARVVEMRAFAEAVAQMRPDVRWSVDGARLVPTRRDGTTGIEMDLHLDPFRERHDATDLVRDVRFSVDETPSYVDVTRVCPCGAARALFERVVPWSVVDASFRAGPGGALHVRRVLDRAGERAMAVVPALECDRHAVYLTERQRERFGLDDSTLARRVEQDVERHVFRCSVHAPGGLDPSRGVVVRGRGIATAALDERLLRAVHRAIGAQIAGPALRCGILNSDALAIAPPDVSPEMVRSLSRIGTDVGGTPIGWPIDVVVEGTVFGKIIDEGAVSDPRKLAVESEADDGG